MLDVRDLARDRTLHKDVQAGPGKQNDLEAKVDTLEYSKSTIENQVSNGLMSEKAYVTKVKRYLSKVT